jgi:hypothetical protein
MQASLIDFDDLLAPKALGAGEDGPPAAGTHQMQQEDRSPAAGAAAAAVDEFNLWSHAASVGQPKDALATGSDPFQGFMPTGHVQQHDLQSSKQQDPNQQQQMTAMHDHGLQELVSQHQRQHQHDQQTVESEQSQDPPATALPQPQKHARQQHSNLQRTASNDMDSSLLPVCERVACLGQLLQQHGAAQGEANASIR